MFVGTAKNNLLHFDLKGGNRSKLVLNGSLPDKVADSTDELEDYTFAENLGIITDVEVGPDGNLYVLTGVREIEGNIYKIVPSVPLDGLAILFLLSIFSRPGKDIFSPREDFSYK